MLDALVSQFRGALGKAFLLAGLLPASVFLLGWTAFLGGRTGVRIAITRVSGNVSDAALLVLAFVGLAIVFCAGRAMLLRFLQFFPVPFLRDVLIAGHEDKLRRLIEKKEYALALLSGIAWARRDFKSPGDLPALTSDQASCLATSARVRETLGSDARVSGNFAFSIARTLTELMQLQRTTPDSDPLKAEIDVWRSILKGVRGEALLGAAEDKARKRWLASFHDVERFPSAEWLHPTALGNRLSALDEYADRRYHVDTSTLWTRLRGVLSKEEREEVGDAQLAVEATVGTAAALVLLGACVTVFLPLTDGFRFSARNSAYAFLPFLAAYLLYRSAVLSFDHLAETVKRLLDLHRLKLIEASGYARPETVDDELELLRELGAFWRQANPRKPMRRLAKPSDKPAAKAEPES